MKILKLLLALSAASMLTPLSASAEEAGTGYVWKAFGGDGATASVMVIEKSQVDEPEAHYKFFMSCMAAEPWMMNISGPRPSTAATMSLL